MDKFDVENSNAFQSRRAFFVLLDLFTSIINWGKRKTNPKKVMLSKANALKCWFRALLAPMHNEQSSETHAGGASNMVPIKQG